MNYHNSLRNFVKFSHVEILELEEETNQKIVVHERPSRNTNNLPNPWIIEPVRNNWLNKNWKEYSKSRKAYSKRNPEKRKWIKGINLKLCSLSNLKRLKNNPTKVKILWWDFN